MFAFYYFIIFVINTPEHIQAISHYLGVCLTAYMNFSLYNKFYLSAQLKIQFKSVKLRLVVVNLF